MKRLLVAVLLLFVLAAGAVAAAFYQRELSVAELAPAYAGGASRFLELADATVHYRDEGAGPALVLLHGTASSLHTWDGWARELAGDFRLVRLDLPAFGLTGPFRHRDYRTARYLELLDAFLDRLGVDRCFMAGNSLGGYFTWRYALHRPERVEKLVLIDATGYPDMPGGGTLDLAKVPVLKTLLLRITPRFLFARGLREVYADDSKVVPDLVDRHFRLTLREGNRQALVDRMKVGRDGDPTRLRELAQPTLVQWGEQDLWVPVEWAHRFAADLPRTELVIYPDAGHVPMEEIPGPTARDARDFLLRPEP